MAKDTKIKDVMSARMITVTKDTTADECVELMRQYNIRHLPTDALWDCGEGLLEKDHRPPGAKPANP